VQYWTVVTALAVFSIGMGYTAGIQPVSQWRFFSWHPFLMTCGMVGLAGIGAVTKKLGGYENTKVRERQKIARCLAANEMDGSVSPLQTPF
jgi:hypothetical protein